MKIACSLENPSCKQHREDTPEAGNNAGGASFLGEPVSGYQRGYDLVVAMLPDARNELFVGVGSWTNDQGS